MTLRYHYYTVKVREDASVQLAQSALKIRDAHRLLCQKEETHITGVSSLEVYCSGPPTPADTSWSFELKL